MAVCLLNQFMSSQLTVAVITDPDDKNFDLEKYLKKVEAES